MPLLGMNKDWIRLPCSSCPFLMKKKTKSVGRLVLVINDLEGLFSTHSMVVFAPK